MRRGGGGTISPVICVSDAYDPNRRDPCKIMAFYLSEAVRIPGESRSESRKSARCTAGRISRNYRQAVRRSGLCAARWPAPAGSGGFNLGFDASLHPGYITSDKQGVRKARRDG